jgi:hypothetical protein
MGSEGIESSNKTICHVRLKRSGACWYVEKANQMLALRCAKYNGTFQKLFLQYKEKISLTMSYYDYYINIYLIVMNINSYLILLFLWTVS